MCNSRWLASRAEFHASCLSLKTLGIILLKIQELCDLEVNNITSSHFFPLFLLTLLLKAPFTPTFILSLVIK